MLRLISTDYIGIYYSFLPPFPLVLILIGEEFELMRRKPTISDCLNFDPYSYLFFREDTESSWDTSSSVSSTMNALFYCGNFPSASTNAAKFSHEFVVLVCPLSFFIVTFVTSPSTEFDCIFLVLSDATFIECMSPLCINWYSKLRSPS